MILLLTILSLFAPQDSLPAPCTCSIPERIEAKTVNLDTLNYLDKKEAYRSGFNLSLQYMKKDTLDERLFYWMGKFALNAAEQVTGNPGYRNRQYKKSNPHVKFKVVQDTIGYIHYEALKNYGPRTWPPSIKKQYGQYAVCANRCLAYRYTHRQEFLGRYIQSLIAMKKFKELLTLVTDTSLTFPPRFNKKQQGEYLLSFSDRFIGYRAYGPGLRYGKTVLDNYEVHERIQQRWNDMYHYTIRNNPHIPDSLKPHMHESVQRFIPEVEEYD